MAHLYLRPRVWLEGFYGSGWDGTIEPLAVENQSATATELRLPPDKPYRTIPTHYTACRKSGLIGPVSLEVVNPENQ